MGAEGQGMWPNNNCRKKGKEDDRGQKSRGCRFCSLEEMWPVGGGGPGVGGGERGLGLSPGVV